MNSSSHVSRIGAEDFGHRMALWPHTIDQLDAIMDALRRSDRIAQKGITLEKRSDVFGNYIALNLPTDEGRPHDVVDALLTAEMISQQDALSAKRPLDELATKDAIIINGKAR